IALPKTAFRNVLNGVLTQDIDSHNVEQWKETGSRTLSEREKEDLLFGNIVCKHLKSNAIALVKTSNCWAKAAARRAGWTPYVRRLPKPKASPCRWKAPAWPPMHFSHLMTASASRMKRASAV